MWNTIRQWFLPPKFPGEEENARSANLLNIILWLFIFAAAVYGLIAPIDPIMTLRRIVIIVPFILIMLAIKQILNKGYVRAVSWSLVIFLWVLFTASMMFGADYKNPAFMGYVVVVILAGLVLSWKSAILWAVFSIFTNAVILYLGESGILQRSDSATPAFAFWAAQSTYIIISSILIGQSLRKIDEALAESQREIAERKRVEANHQSLIKELESKNAELERFTYTVSHDLKSPLITIGGFIGLLEEDTKSGDGERIERDIQRIREAKDKMHTLLDELLELSRIGRLVNTSVTVPFSEIVDEALMLTAGRLTESHVTVRVNEDLPIVTGDYPRLVEVMQNLIDNAAKFGIPGREMEIEIGTRVENDETIFYVKDNGIGIENAYHQKIFGLFDKLNTESEGTGIGLALVKRIIEVHGGRIWVESQGVNQGSRFCFTLPST